MNKGASDLDDNGRWLHSQMKDLQKGFEIYAWKPCRIEELRAEIKLRNLDASEIPTYTMSCGVKEHYTIFLIESINKKKRRDQ